MRKKFRDSYLAYSMMMGFFFLGNCLCTALISIYLLDKGFPHTRVSLMVAFSQLATLLINSEIGILRNKFGGKKSMLRF